MSQSDHPPRGSSTGHPVGPAHPRCRNIATKTDYYRDPAQPVPWEPGSGSTAVYWCILTQKSLGPDGLPCDRLDCCPERECYVAPPRRPGGEIEEEPLFESGL